MLLVLPIIASAPFALLAWHLFGLARRSRGRPERLLCGLFSCLALGVPLRLTSVGLKIEGLGGDAADLLNACSTLIFALALVSLVAFVRLVFRAGSEWGRGVFYSFAAVILQTSVVSVLYQGDARGVPAGIAMGVLGLFAFGWAFGECLAYHAAMRRRLTLGLADPIVVNRFLLWSVWTGTLAVATGQGLAIRVGMLASGASLVSVGGVVDPFWSSLIHLARGFMLIAGPVVAVSVWLSFSPPERYRRFLARRARRLVQ